MQMYFGLWDMGYDDHKFANQRIASQKNNALRTPYVAECKIKHHGFKHEQIIKLNLTLCNAFQNASENLAIWKCNVNNVLPIHWRIDLTTTYIK